MLVEMKRDGDGLEVGVWGILRKPDGSCRMSGGFCQPLKAAFEQDGNLQVKDE